MRPLPRIDGPDPPFWQALRHREVQVRGACGARQVRDCAFVHYMAAAPVVTSIIYGREPS